MEATALNPFVVGGAIGDPAGRGFYGRDKIFSFVRSALNSTYRPPILLLGQRRIGKSSVLRQLPTHLPAEYYCIYFDLQGKGQMDLDGVLFGLARAIADGLKIPRPEREQATEAEFDRFVQRVFDALEGRRERLVLLFDEFDVVDEREATRESAINRFIPYLADLIARHPQVGYIFVVGRKTEELSGALNGILLKDSVQRPIGRLEKGEIADLVREGSGEVLVFGPSAVDRIYELTAGHPFCTQVLCHVIWDQAIQKSNRQPIPVFPEDVDHCIPQALELGANGMNWIFDGLTDPVHRLVLAAIAQEADPALGTSVDRAGVDSALRRRSTMLEAVEIDRAIRELQSWDVVGQSGSGFQFSVPLIGLWIKDRRPLERLEREVRFANPRAWKFYELALDSRSQGNLDQAIEEFRGALRANPSFADAQRGLASALFQRGRRSEMQEIIENLERALDIDPTGPRTELLEALTSGVASTDKASVIKVRLARIRELDPGGHFEARALRAINGRATQILEQRGSIMADQAAALYELTGAHVEASAAGKLYRQYDRRIGVTGLCWFAFTIAIFIVGFLPFPAIVPWVRLAVALCGGTSFAVGMELGEPRAFRWMWLAFVIVATAVTCALIMYFGKISNITSSLLAYIGPVGAAFIGVVVSPGRGILPVLPEDQADKQGRPYSRVSGATNYLLHGRLPDEPEKKGT